MCEERHKQKQTVKCVRHLWQRGAFSTDRMSSEVPLQSIRAKVEAAWHQPSVYLWSRTIIQYVQDGRTEILRGKARVLD